MVEGPGATRNGRKVQPAIGGKVKEITWTRALSKDYKGRILQEAFSVGKELFLIFADEASGEENALRLHFGMNGCLWLQSQGAGAPSKIPVWRQKEGFSLTIIIEREANGSCIILQTTSSVTTELSAFVARSKRQRLGSRDVCGDDNVFDSETVLESIQKRSLDMIADVVLDQDKFPGVGNIIKIEGLHKAGVHPRRIVSTLSLDELCRLIHHCRDYAMGWLRSGRAPNKSVYNQTMCQTCGDRVKMVKMGNDLRRVTFWCPQCQPFAMPLEPNYVLQIKRSRENSPQVDITPSKRPATAAKPTITAACPVHGSRTLQLKRVRKQDSSNRNRLFHSCRNSTCQFFSWADSRFPSCKCGKKSILRVSKTEKTGGRWFLSCSVSEKGAGCGFFSWAKSEQLLAFGKHLTPLL
jgi:formamidopyrimidine-DNA glycosylase